MPDDKKLIRAKDATAYDLVGMPDERFELMVFRLVRLEFPRVFKPANTLDGGADVVLPREGVPGYERCWQSKHFPRAISWDKCQASLAAAREHWDPEHYTFVFPRELTSREQKTFDGHFRGPDADITVDHWNGEELQFRLCGSDQGQRVARTFFDHAVDDHKRTLQAIEASGSLDSPDDVLDRLLNIGGSLADRDDFFTYPGALHETDEDGPPLTPGTVMSFEKSDGDVTSRVDIVPRDVAQLIRNRGRSVTWHNFNANVSTVRPLRGGQLVRVEMGTSAKVLGQLVDLGYLRMDFTDYKVVPPSAPANTRSDGTRRRGRDLSPLWALCPLRTARVSRTDALASDARSLHHRPDRSRA